MYMKKIFCVLLSAILCLSLFTISLAESWFCPECGTACDGNFCSNCGTKKPSGSTSPKLTLSTISNITASMMDNGDVMLRWDDSTNSGSYRVTYTSDGWGKRYYEQENYSGKFAQLIALIPGVSYNIMITGDNTSATYSYTVPSSAFKDFPSGGKYLEISTDRFSLSDIEDAPLETFKLKVRWPRLKEDRVYSCKLALKTPVGYCSHITYWDTFTMLKNKPFVETVTSIKQDWLDKVQENYGSIPTGKYTFQIFFDGALYDYVSFTLAN